MKPCPDCGLDMNGPAGHDCTISRGRLFDRLKELRKVNLYFHVDGRITTRTTDSHLMNKGFGTPITGDNLESVLERLKKEKGV